MFRIIQRVLITYDNLFTSKAAMQAGQVQIALNACHLQDVMQLEEDAFERWSAYVMKVGKDHCVESLSAVSAAFCRTEGVVYVSTSLQTFLTTAHLSYTSIYVLNTISLYDQKDTPGRCICEKGWSGDDCNICQPYPGCINGDCATVEGEKRPWTCTCNEGFEYGYNI